MPANLENSAVVNVIREAAEFTRKMGFANEADVLIEFSERFKAEKPSLKLLRGPVLDAKDNASRRIREEVLYDAVRCVRPEKTREYEEFNRIWLAFGDIIYPRKQPVPTKIKGLVPGSKNETSVLGDVKAAPTIAEQSLRVTALFADAVVKGELGKAYLFCATELRAKMSLKQFEKKLGDADQEYNGKPITYTAQDIFWLYADGPSRNESNKDAEWPKETPKENKRAIVGGWFTDQKQGKSEFGRNIAFWVTEETDGYRIA
ncbi:MAG: hypothetical protein JWM68_595 [Verrucomicrobiales bacterium]|nr:hypothetical protein [Verrucomicrobiales bacterium]